MSRRASSWLWFLTFGVIAAALWLRGGDLSFRPLHNDEAINAFKLERLWREGEYRYDPHEYHGPTLYYGSLPVLRVASWFDADQPSVAAMRWVLVLCGVGLVTVTGLARGPLGRWGALAAAGLAAVSPAMTYFSRDYIHELMLVWFTAWVLWALERYRQRSGGWQAAAWVGAGVGLMYATKETFVFAVGAMVAGGVLAAWAAGPDTVEAASEGKGFPARARSVGRILRGIAFRDIGVAFGVFGLVSGLLFTSFLRHPAGAWDAIRTYLIWGERAGGATPHLHPWYFYLERLVWFRYGNGPVWTEAAIVLLAVVGVGLGWKSGAPGACGPVPVRFLAGYTLFLGGVYAVIRYKTPWCLLGFHHGLILLAGVGASCLAAWRPGRLWRVAVGAAYAIACGHLAWQSERANGEFAADFRNPHVYGQTSMDVFNLLELVEGVAAAQPEGRSTPLSVAVPDSSYWPLPWYLRRFDRAGWYDRMPDPLVPGIVVSSLSLKAGLEEKGEGKWIQVGMFELRPRSFVEVHVATERWQRYLASRAGPSP